MATMNISLPDAMKRWVEDQTATGRYSNASDYVRDLIRRDEERQTKIEAIRAALIEGEESGMSDRSPEDVREAVKNRLRENGQLPLE